RMRTRVTPRGLLAIGLDTFGLRSRSVMN
ncbi:MAG: hypothetical protein JWR28_3054, partial [Modestobacter sp.]|nr:hypothetical protein [Modestobacter sp.]